MNLRVASVGKDRSGLFSPAAAEYQKRLTHYVRFAAVDVPASRHPGARAREEEAKALLALASPRDWLVALDERGKELSSLELAQFIRRAQNEAKDVLFVIGGDEGLGDAVRQRAHLTLALSRMTLPHRLAKVVLLEQLYRAFSLLKGEPYHK
ncbi:MAG: 23S rRNA (pseudouridine(1915)-N(3))-methyltransferase RlmH [Myxococcota bacterium]